MVSRSIFPIRFRNINCGFFGKGKAGALKTIEHLGYVQIDTISVVERAHHHTLFTRVEDYKPLHLDILLEKDKSIFEYWSHAAAYIPMRDYRFSLIRKERFASAKVKWYSNKKMTKYVFDRILDEGPLQSKDFEEKKARAGWWEWKDAKRALEQLFMEGKLMVAGRQGFQKVYDLTERVLPKGTDTRLPSQEEYAGYLIDKAIRANGIVGADEIAYLRNYMKTTVAKLLAAKLESGEIVPLNIKEAGKDKFYTTPENLARAERTKPHKAVKILSPFDNTVIQRKRLKRIFDFDYTIECYVPEAKRKYGYFCLPVLFGDSFAARMDCKAHRSEKLLEVKRIFFEKNFNGNEALKNGLNKALKKFAAFNGCEKIVMARPK